MATRKTRNSKEERPKKKIDCYFCTKKIEPDYKNYKSLSTYLSRRAKIAPGKRSGLCAKHQRKMSREVKRARHLGLLPFTINI